MSDVKRKSAPAKTVTTIEEILAAKKAHRVTLVLDIDGQEIDFVFQALAGAAYQALVAEHNANPSPALGFNLETASFPLIEACLVEPALSREALEEIWESPAWSSGERQALVRAVLEVNGSSSIRPTPNRAARRAEGKK